MRVLLATRDEPSAIVVSWLRAAATREPIECRAVTVVHKSEEEGFDPAENPDALLVERVRRCGDVVDTILAEAETFRPALIALMTRGLRGIAATAGRSTGAQLVEHSSIPLLLFGPQCQHGNELKQLLIPLDGSAYAGRAIGAIAGVARSLGVDAFLLQVQHEEVSPPGGGGRVTSSDVLESAYVMTVAREMPGVEVTWDVAHGDAADRIVEAAASLEGCVIVMTTHGHSDLRRKLIGSVAEQVVHKSTRPVVVVPPHWSP